MNTLDRRWLPLNALRAFEMVGRHMSFTAAAHALSVSQSAVSRHVIALEGLLGAPLFDRRPHAFALTDAGAALLPVVRKSLDRIEQAMNEIRTEGGGQPRSLRVQLPPTFAHLLAVPLLRDFRAENPDVILDIESLSGTGFTLRDTDASVIYAKPHASERVASLLWMERLLPLCHPDVAARLADCEPADRIARAERLHVKIEGQPRHQMWELLTRSLGVAADIERGLVFDTAILAAQYALSGEGVALLDRHLFAADIAASRLVPAFDAVQETGYGYFLTVHPEDLADPAIARLRSWMIRRFGQAI